MTILIEGIILWGASMLLGVSFMEIILLGALFFFGGVWLYLYLEKQSNNVFSASVKGWTGQDAGNITLFRIHISPVFLGMILFLVLSLVTTFIYYSSYIF